MENQKDFPKLVKQKIKYKNKYKKKLEIVRRFDLKQNKIIINLIKILSTCLRQSFKYQNLIIIFNFGCEHIFNSQKNLFENSFKILY